MIASVVSQKLNAVFQNLPATPTRRLEGSESWSNYDADRERDRFQALSDNSSARDGSYEVAVTNHPFAPPYKSQAQVSGDSQQGELFRQDGLYLGLPVGTEGVPTFLTTVHAQFNGDEMTKLELVESRDGTTARRLFADQDEPWKNYVEEYFLATP